MYGEDQDAAGGTVFVVRSQSSTPEYAPKPSGSRPEKVAAPVRPAGAVPLTLVGHMTTADRSAGQVFRIDI